MDAARSEDLATLCLTAVEGALILGRAAESPDVFDAVERQLLRLVD